MEEHRVMLRGGPFDGASVVWDTEASVADVVGNDEGLAVTGDYVTGSSYVRINADVAVWNTIASGSENPFRDRR